MTYFLTIYNAGAPLKTNVLTIIKLRKEPWVSDFVSFQLFEISERISFIPFVSVGGMRRSWSCVELGKFSCRETTQTKRVSFSVTVPPPAYPDIENTAYDLCPPKVIRV